MGSNSVAWWGLLEYNRAEGDDYCRPNVSTERKSSEGIFTLPIFHNDCQTNKTNK